MLPTQNSEWPTRIHIHHFEEAGDGDTVALGVLLGLGFTTGEGDGLISDGEICATDRAEFASEGATCEYPRAAQVVNDSASFHSTAGYL